MIRIHVLVLTLLIAGTASAQELTGRTIERVEVTGNESVATDTIRVYLGLYPGEPYRPEVIRENFPNLWQTGLFDDIRVEAVEGDTGGVVIRIEIEERARIGGVEYRGNEAIKTADLIEQLQNADIEIHVGSTLEQTLLNRAAEEIESTYAEAGQEGVSVETILEDMEIPGEKRVVFKIDEGIKAKVAGIYFEGNERFSSRKLRRTMKEVKKHNLITWIRKKNLYTPSKLSQDVEKIRELYQDSGYKDVQIGEPRIETVRNRVRITIPLREGEVHHFRSLSVEGNELFPDDLLLSDFPLQEGEVLQQGVIRTRVEFFEELYRRRGHIYAFIDPEYVEVEDTLVDVKLHVFEGDQFRLGRLEFEGNQVTKDKVLRREIYIREGDVMDMETFRLSLYKLGQLGYFKLTDNPEFEVNQEDQTVDVTVRGKEEGRNDVQFGGGYSEAYGFFAQFQFATRNFLGEGESLGVNFQQGRHQDFFSLSYADPWFLDRPHSFGVSIFSRETQLPTTVGYTSKGTGGSIAYGFRLDRFESINFTYGYEEREEESRFQPGPDREGNVPLPLIRDLSFTTSAFVPAYRFDSRDNPFDTTRGMKASLALSYSGGALGGTVHLIKPIVNFTYFHPLTRRTSLNFNLEGGQIFPQDEGDCAETFEDLEEFANILCVPRSERFYVGGEQSIRGFRPYTLGPREELNGTELVVGGHKYSVFNIEHVYRVNDPLRLVLFGDAGQAYSHDQDWDFGALRYSAGVELRVFLPVFQFPLRFIYARNLDPEPNDMFDSFQFAIGSTF